MAILLSVAMLGEESTDPPFFQYWSLRQGTLMVSQAFVHVLAAALLIAWMGQKTRRLRNWLILAAIILVCGGVAAVSEGLLFRVTTVIAVHLATLAAGLAVAHAANRSPAPSRP